MDTVERRCGHFAKKQVATFRITPIRFQFFNYAEVGGIKEMLMVCMAGTAVKIESNKLAFSKLDKFNAIEQNAKELAKLKSIKYPDTDYAL